MSEDQFSFFTKASEKPAEEENKKPEGEQAGEQAPESSPEGETQKSEQAPEGEQAPPNKEEGKAPESERRPEGLTKEKIFEVLDQDENAYLEYLSKKTGKQLTSLDDLKEVKEVEKEPDLPEDVKKYWEFKKETGRDFNDFLKANKDWTTESKDAVVMEHMRQVEGLDGDMLKEAFELEYQLDEDASDRERRLAEIRKEKRYNQALKALKDQQRQFSLPTEDKSNQRQAEDLRRTREDQFKQGMLNATQKVDSLSIDDFSYKLDKDPQTEQRFNASSFEDVFAKYKKGDTFDYESLYKTIKAGENVEKLAKAYAEHYKNKVVEDELKRMSNQKKPGTHQPSDGPVDVDINKVKSFFRGV